MEYQGVCCCLYMFLGYTDIFQLLSEHSVPSVVFGPRRSETLNAEGYCPSHS